VRSGTVRDARRLDDYAARWGVLEFGTRDAPTRSSRVASVCGLVGAVGACSLSRRCVVRGEARERAQ